MREQPILGRVDGIRDSLLAKLRLLYDSPLEDGDFLPRGLMQFLSAVTGEINREIAIYITRDGEIVEISIGTDRDVELRDWRLRRNPLRLSGVRCVHTHPNGDGHLSDVDLSALTGFRYDAIVAVGVKDGQPTFVQAAFLTDDHGGTLVSPTAPWYRLPEAEWLRQIDESDTAVGHTMAEGDPKTERAVLMGIESEASLDELARLAETAGAVVVGRFLQKRAKPDGATCIGSGRVAELTRDCQALDADLCIFDEELSGIQMRNLEQALRVKVVDRTTLILDIFAQRATSSEGKLQVEMAQLQYQSARLIGQGVVLSRLAGGIGTRGPGESRLEIDRRRIRERITDLRRRLDAVEKQRDLRRKIREKNEIPVVALVGYTNAGKSSLLNRLSDAGVYEADQLFATLDAVSRRLETPEHTAYLLVDTVGFIRKLPHTLVKAFRSTLEEAARADLLLIVSDGASDELMIQHDTVEAVLKDLGATQQPRIEVLNKADLGTAATLIPGALSVSAKTGAGLDELTARIAQELQKSLVTETFFVPFSRYAALASLRVMGKVLDEQHTDEGTRLTLSLAAEDRAKALAKFGQDILCP